MKIAIVAANGRSGKAFVNAALAAGHQVTAGVHHHTNNLPNSSKLTVRTCDATNPEDLRKLLQGQDAVISFIGHKRGSPADVQSVAISQIMAVMDELKLRRIVSLTGSGVRFQGDKISLLDRILNSFILLIDSKRIKDGIKQGELLKTSRLEWTIIRALKLTNGRNQPHSLSEHGPAKWFVSRRTVAKTVLEVLEQRSYIRKAPFISRTGHQPFA